MARSHFWTVHSLKMLRMHSKNAANPCINIKIDRITAYYYK